MTMAYGSLNRRVKLVPSCYFLTSIIYSLLSIHISLFALYLSYADVRPEPAIVTANFCLCWTSSHMIWLMTSCHHQQSQYHHLGSIIFITFIITCMWPALHKGSVLHGNSFKQEQEQTGNSSILLFINNQCMLPLIYKCLIFNLNTLLVIVSLNYCWNLFI